MTDGGRDVKPHIRVAGNSLARYMRLVWRTSRAIREPADQFARLDAATPAIVAMWHGQFMLIPVARPLTYRPRIMVARHGDAELLAVALNHFDLELIRGAGAGGRKKDRGGREALRLALRALEQGHNVAMTADVPPGPARIVGPGIVTLARLSGRPILPVAIASSRYHALPTWSRMTINLPYSQIGVVVGDPITVARDADPPAQEAARLEVERRLDRATARAYELAGVSAERATPPAKRATVAAPGLRLAAYRTVMRAATPLAPLILSHRQRRGKEDPLRMAERLGKTTMPRPPGRLIWAHAASVGETNAILPVLVALSRRHPGTTLLLTTVTVTSAKIAAERLPAGALHQYIPLDAPKFVDRFLEHWRPDLAIFTESEIWPTLILATDARAIPMVIANARMSERSYKRWKRNPTSANALFGRFRVILAQTDVLARRFSELGGRRVISAGNLKIDAPPPPVDTAKLAVLSMALGDRPHWLAASTHDGEEAIVLDAHARLVQRFPDLVTIIAPRHPERGPAVAALAAAQGHAVTQRSDGAVPAAGPSVYVADTLGELGTFYASSPVAFVGGSLVVRGGQNPIEAVHHGAAVIAGPSRENFADIFRAIEAADGVTEVTNAASLTDAVGRLLADPAARAKQLAGARAAIAKLGGALDTTLAALDPLLLDSLPPEASGVLQRAS